MKTLLTLAIILTTIATQAQVVNIHEPGKVYAEIPHTYTPITGYRWPRYHTRTHAHYTEGWRQADTMPACDEGYTVANVGWTLVDDVAVVTWDCEPIPPPPVPDITPRQMRLTLLSLGKTDADIEAIIDGIEDVTQREAARIEWRHARVFKRHHPLIEAFIPALGLTEEQADDLFRAAAQIE